MTLTLQDNFIKTDFHAMVWFLCTRIMLEHAKTCQTKPKEEKNVHRDIQKGKEEEEESKKLSGPSIYGLYLMP